MRWSKLQRALYNLLADNINLQVHCTLYRMDSMYGRTNLPRYWITLEREIIFDYPKQFTASDGTVASLSGHHTHYPYETDVPAISKLIREYIDTPRNELLTRVYWGLINILRAADRRIGKRQLQMLQRKTHNKAAIKVIKARLQ